MILIVKYHITNMLYRFSLVLLRTLITYISVMFFVVLKLHENKDGLGLLYVVPRATIRGSTGWGYGWVEKGKCK